MSEIEQRISARNEEIRAMFPQNDQTWISVSKIKEALKMPFDREGVAAKTFKRHYENPDSQYYHKSVEEIIKMWEDKAERSRQCGTLVDAMMEYIFTNIYAFRTDVTGMESYIHDMSEDNKQIENLSAKLHSGVEFVADAMDCGASFECREQELLMPVEMNGKTYVINGRLDAIFRNSMGLNTLIDWKSNDEIKKSNPFQKLLGPCSKMDDCEHIIYTIQLYLYKFMLESVYATPCNKTIIVHTMADEDNTPYTVIKPAFEYDPDFILSIIRFAISTKDNHVEYVRDDSGRVSDESRIETFRNELDMIKNPLIREFCIEMLLKADDYFFTMPASTTGKYHPDFALGEGGLVRHTKAVTFVAASLAEAEGFESDTVDSIITAAICHDIKKKGEDGSQFTTKDHPECAARFVERVYESIEGDKPEIHIIEGIKEAIISHMGKWGNVKPESRIQMLLHEADYVASRKAFNMKFDAVNDVRKSEPAKLNENCEPGDVVMPFGKHAGKSIKEIAAEAPGYLKWIAGNEEFHNEEIKAAVLKFLGR